MPEKIPKKFPRMLVVKRRGHEESFDERKAYASCYFAARTSHFEEKEAEELCDKVMRDLKRWLGKRQKVNSQHIFEQMTKLIKKHHKDVGFMYETHRDLS